MACGRLAPLDVRSHVCAAANSGYWAHYFLREVRKYGGLAVAKKLLGANRVSTGFDRLIASRRADLSIDAIALSSRFKQLFSAEERAVAAKRIEALPRSAIPTNRVRDPAFPTDLVGDAYSEGSVERVSVNRYERSGRARLACIRHHYTGVVCDIDFEERYGEIGKGFTHVHQKRPLAALGKRYRLNAVKDLVPVLAEHAYGLSQTQDHGIQYLGSRGGS